MARQKQHKLAAQQTQQLLVEMQKNNQSVQQMLSLLRGGFLGIGVGNVLGGVGQVQKLFQVSKKILQDQKKEKEKEKSRFLSTLSQLGPYLPYLLLAAVLSQQLPDNLPESLRTFVPFVEKKKHPFRKFLEKMVDFQTPTPYLFLTGGVVGALVYVQSRKPDSTLGQLLHKMMDTTNQNLLSFSKLTQNLFEENFKKFRDVQQSSDQPKDERIKEYKLRNQKLEDENFAIQEKFHDLKVEEVKSRHLLEDCAKKTTNYGELFEKSKNYFAGEADESQQRKLIPGTPTPPPGPEAQAPKKTPWEEETTSLLDDLY
jgi:uncharacterized membrane protein